MPFPERQPDQRQPIQRYPIQRPPNRREPPNSRWPDHGHRRQPPRSPSPEDQHTVPVAILDPPTPPPPKYRLYPVLSVPTPAFSELGLYDRIDTPFPFCSTIDSLIREQEIFERSVAQPLLPTPTTATWPQKMELLTPVTARCFERVGVNGQNGEMTGNCEDEVEYPQSWLAKHAEERDGGEEGEIAAGGEETSTGGEREMSDASTTPGDENVKSGAKPSDCTS